MNFEPIGNSVHATEFLALKVLLARLYLQVSMFLRILLTLKTYLKWTLNVLYFGFCFLDDLRKLHFPTRYHYFYHNWRWERGKNQFFRFENFEGFYLNLRRNSANLQTQLTLDNLDTQKIELQTNPSWWHSRNQTLSLVPSE